MTNVRNAARYNAHMDRIFDKSMAEKEKQRLKWEISDKILEVANLYSEVTTSDLQGIASAKATEIVDMVKKEIAACGVAKPGNALNAVQCLQEKGLI